MLYSYLRLFVCFDFRLYPIPIGFLAEYLFLYWHEHKYLYGTNSFQSITSGVIFKHGDSIDKITLVFPLSLITACDAISLFPAMRPWPSCSVLFAKSFVIRRWSNGTTSLFVHNVRSKYMTASSSITAKIAKNQLYLRPIEPFTNFIEFDSNEIHVVQQIHF